MKEAAAEKQHQQRLQFQLHAEVGTLGQKLGPQFRVEIAVEETIEENIKVLAGVIDNAYPCQRCSLYGHIGMITTKQHKRRQRLLVPQLHITCPDMQERTFSTYLSSTPRLDVPSGAALSALPHRCMQSLSHIHKCTHAHAYTHACAFPMLLLLQLLFLVACPVHPVLKIVQGLQAHQQ
eukprot:scaffold57998_cov18-Tisochrysis_lutea.AAC.1